jgi:hypothetical protein
MNKGPVKPLGWIIGVNVKDQYFLISFGRPGLLKVFANNALFKRLNHILATHRLAGEKGKEKKYVLIVRGKVLVRISKL